MIKRLFARFKTKCISCFNIRKTLIIFGITLVTFTLPFPIGALSKRTVDERCANYFAQISKEYTIDASEKKLSGLLVEPKPDSSVKVRQDTDKAITELWGVFKGENATFAPVLNGNRKDNVFFSDSEYSSENLSLVYTDVGGSSEPYHVDKKTNKIVDYKFQSSPLALMFPSRQSGMQEKFHIYISQRQAERKLVAQGINKIDYDSLKTLLNTETELVINGKPVLCVIDNIYLDNFPHSFKLSNHDYYYASDIGTIIGDFVFVIFYAYKYSGDITLKKQSLYVMSEFSYRNEFFLRYAKELYSPDNYSYDYVRTNLKKGFEPESKILNQALLSSELSIASLILLILCFTAFLFDLFIIYRFQIFNQPLSLLIVSCASILPYLITKVIFGFVHDIFIFSSFSLILSLILLVLGTVFIFVINFLGRPLMEEEKHE